MFIEILGSLNLIASMAGLENVFPEYETPTQNNPRIRRLRMKYLSDFEKVNINYSSEGTSSSSGVTVDTVLKVSSIAFISSSLRMLIKMAVIFLFS